MQDPTNLMEVLKTNNYLLMTDEEGNEVYDDEGNLLLYHTNGDNCLSVPNTEEIRTLYDLSLKPSGIKVVMKREEISLPGKLVPVIHENDNKKRTLEENNEMEERDVDMKPDAELKRIQLSDQSSDKDILPAKALVLLTTLVNSPRYSKYLKDKSFPLKNRIWEDVYKDMTKEGWKFGKNIKEGASVLAEKWKLVESTVLKKKTPRTLMTPDLRKSIISDIEERRRRDALGISQPSTPSSAELLSNRKPKNKEIPLQIVDFLLRLMTEKYQNIATKPPDRGSKVWEKIFEDIQSQGFDIPGETKQEKVSRLFQKWRNMKRAFANYQVAKYHGKTGRRPFFYETMFNIFSKVVLNTPNELDCESEEELGNDEEDDDSEYDCSFDALEYAQVDHCYNQSSQTSMQSEPTETKTFSMPQSISIPSTSGTEIVEVLNQIKSLNETSLAMQQQNFSKMFSLIENLVSQQTKLTTVISDYIMSETAKSSHKNHRN